MGTTDVIGRSSDYCLKIYIADIRPGSCPGPGAGISGSGAESAMARKLAFRALRDYLECASDSFSEASGFVEEARTGKGKPYFPDCPDFQYSISHSGGIVVCGTIVGEAADGSMESVPVGIDIQKIPDNPKRVMKIADHFFSEQERDSLHTLMESGTEKDISSALILFNRYWTARESYMKLTGRGLSESFRNFRPDLTGKRIMITAPDLSAEGGTDRSAFSEIYLTECPAPEGFCLTVCSYKVPGTIKFL